MALIILLVPLKPLHVLGTTVIVPTESLLAKTEPVADVPASVIISPTSKNETSGALTKRIIWFFLLNLEIKSSLAFANISKLYPLPGLIFVNPAILPISTSEISNALSNVVLKLTGDAVPENGALTS